MAITVPPGHTGELPMSSSNLPRPSDRSRQKKRETKVLLSPEQVLNLQQQQKNYQQAKLSRENFHNAVNGTPPKEDQETVPGAPQNLADKANLTGMDLMPELIRSKLEQKRPDFDIKDQPINDKPRYVTPAKYSSKFIRATLPSGFIFYDFDTIAIRPIEVVDMAKYTTAREERDITLIIDVIDSLMDVDVRSLTIGDFYHLLYQIRIRSFTKTPFTVTWTSKYGNKNTLEINNTNILPIIPNITRDEYLLWQQRGFSAPKVRDLELGLTENMSPEFKFMFDRAQYLQGTTVDEKIARLEDGGMDILEDIRVFANLIVHGVQETLELVDKSFNAEIWLEQLNTRLDEARIARDRGAIAMLEVEIRQWRDRINKGQIHPDKEVQRIAVDLLNFFPSL